MITVAVSGGFDPLHNGHIRLFKEARKLGDKLVVILNNDNWLLSKKGRIFMSQDIRKEILEELRSVDRVYLTEHIIDDSNRSVCRELEKIKPDIFVNGGDKTINNIPEVFICNKLGIQMKFIKSGTDIHSSNLLKNWEELQIES